MPLFKRTPSEFLFRRFVLKHYGSNLLVDLQIDAKKEVLEYIAYSVTGQQAAVRIIKNPGYTQ